VNSNKSEIIDVTQSLCPVCLKILPAVIRERDGQVYMDKTCPEHGEFHVYLWPDAERYRWFQSFILPTTPRRPQTETVKGCPLDCGLCPHHKRGITLAEIEVTWRCNLACPVCYLGNIQAPPDPTPDAIASMLETIQRCDGKGTCLQITGGEPTIRADLPDIIALARQTGFTVIELNSNGLVIGRDRSFLHALKKAGLTNVYLQFDGVTPEATKKLRGEDLLNSKLQAMENCREEGVPVILAPTIVSGVNDDQLGDLIALAMRNLDVIAGLAIQPAFRSGRFDVAICQHLSLGDIATLISEQTGGRIAARDFWPVGCIHPLCDGSTYLLGTEEDYVPFTRGLTENDYRMYFDSASPQGSVMADMVARMHPGDLPPGLPVLIMSYMDAWTMDLKRMQECNLGVTTADGRTIPFCAYHLTDARGRRLYPLESRRATAVERP
jgi:uncharacterized radical SAM superfamily Fe-S cluster-containing enzyme